MFSLINDTSSMGSVIKPMLGATSGCSLLVPHFLLFFFFSSPLFSLSLSKERMQ